jgi:hypothetical protein
MDNFGVDNWHTLGRAPVHLLLHRDLLSFLTLFPRDVHFHRMRSTGQGKQLVEIEVRELVAHHSTEGRLPGAPSVSGECAEFKGDWRSALAFSVVIRAMCLGASIGLSALV